MKLGVFGGTFDPPHIAHLIAAADALDALSLDRVLFVPAAIPPHKRHQDRTPSSLRLEMLRAAVAGDERFDVATLELERDGPSYTVDTLRTLAVDRPDDELHLLIGADQWAEFSTWKDPGEIAELARICVLGRGGAGERGGTAAGAGGRAGAGDGAGEAAFVEVTRVDLSSSEVRRRVAEGRSIRYLVPVGVAAIMEREGLYR